SLTVGAFVGGAVAGMPLQNIADAAGQVSQAGIIPVFNKGLEGKAYGDGGGGNQAAVGGRLRTVCRIGVARRIGIVALVQSRFA
uniref:hypothetical protein n=1 Tax=Neisseria gonorrhoeae TaxID=485 RepID=UPI00384B3A1C